jgi:hypothetical protein
MAAEDGNGSAGFAAKVCGVLGLLCAAVTAISARASDPTVTAIGEALVSDLPTNWIATQGGWQYLNIANCFALGYCFGSNPSGSDGMPSIPQPNGSVSPIFQWDATEAVVIVLRTPPPMAYFGFTQYLYSRPGLPNNPVAASLSDTLNQLEFSVIGSTAAGQNVFDQYAVVVWTANMNAFNTIATALNTQGISTSNINLIPAPVNGQPGPNGVPPLNMGYGSQYDEYFMLMRTALPTVPTDWQQYMQDLPFYVVKVTPPAGSTLNPAPTVGYASETTGIEESTNQQSKAQLAIALNQLVVDIKSRLGSAYTLTPQTVTFSQETGWQCIDEGVPCSGDNHDGLYSQDVTQAAQPTHPNDIVIVAGVNHQETQKALYISHAVTDPATATGIVAVTSSELTSQSALYFAGASASSPKAKMYQSLYAYAISYDCTGLQYCLQIPAPTSTNPVGLNFPSPFLVNGRAYVDPVRLTAPLNIFVRPSLQEIVPHQGLLGIHK